MHIRAYNLVHLVQISPACGPNMYQIMSGESSDFQVSVFVTVAQKSFNDKFTPKIDFPIRYFMLPLLTLILEVKNLSIHYLSSIWTTCWWNLNKIVRYEKYKIWAFKQKMVNHFWEVLMPFWKTFLWHKKLLYAKVIFHCSKN